MRSGKLVLKRFFQDLSDISERFDDVTDTEVREALFRIINYHYIWDLPLPAEPKRFLMLHADGDRVVAEAVGTFFRHLFESDAMLLPPGLERHKFIHDHEVQADDGSRYERFIGAGDLVPPKVPLPNYYFVSKIFE